MNAAKVYLLDGPRSGRQTLQEIAFIGPHPRRHCRIASFGTGLCAALQTEYPELSSSMVATGDELGVPTDEACISHVIPQQNPAAYRSAARLLNASHADVVCLHHANGLYGGPGGSFLLALLDELKKPLVTTFHAVEPDPTLEEDRVMNALFRSSGRLVTTTISGRDVLRESYDVPLRKVEVSPYGVSNAPVLPPNPCKEAVGLEGRSVLLTAGHVAPGKGIEHVIQSLSSVVHQYPDVLYVVVGATHPDALRTNGESYRRHLESLARECGVSDRVHFVDRFVDDEELDLYICAADICLTPYDVESRTCSTTLSRMIGMGKAVVSTPYRHAREMLAEGRGRLVRFASPMALASAILDLLNDSSTATSIRQRAWAHGRNMVWPKIAQAYMDCFVAAANQPGAARMQLEPLVCDAA